MKCCNLLVLTSFFIGVSIGNTEGARILGLFNLNGRSHFVMFEALMKGLAARGHQVYVVGHFPQKKQIGNYTDISIQETLPTLVNSFTMEFALDFGIINVLDFIFHRTMNMCEIMMEHPKVQHLLNSEEKFDLVISELLGPDCFIGLSYRYKVPFINMVSSVVFPWGNDRISNPDNPAFIPNYFVPYTHHMSFSERVINTVVTEASKLAHYYFAELPMEKLAKKYYGDDVPPISELKKNVSLILVNSHFSLNCPRPTVPGFVEVGGLHIQSDGKLPEDMETFLNGARYGAIYFSLGSLVRAETMPKHILEVFISVFSELPQRVVWKIDNVQGLPENVKVAKWLPQFEILSHPNVKLFITHGGLMGTQEAVHAGVPMVGIPLFADQELNLRNCKSKGVALIVKYDSITKETMSAALRTVLTDPRYQRNAKHLSTLFRDRPQTPLETAVYWTEYVIRHGGVQHMRSAAVDLPWYQHLLLDVISFILLCFVMTCGFLYFILKTMISICYGKKTSKLKSN